jgi:hypothetical protein
MDLWLGRCLDDCLKAAAEDGFEVLVASHNKTSIERAVIMMQHLGLEPPSKQDVYFGQLLGMADPVTFVLGRHGYRVRLFRPCNIREWREGECCGWTSTLSAGAGVAIELPTAPATQATQKHVHIPSFCGPAAPDVTCSQLTNCWLGAKMSRHMELF